MKTWILGLAFTVSALSGCGRKEPEVPALRPLAGEELELQPGVRDPSAGLRRVAITVDDLGTSEYSSDPALSEAMLEALRRHQAPVAVFANCRKLRTDVLQQWQRAGATIGNHTNAHLTVDDTSGPRVSDAWWQGVVDCDEHLHELVGAPLRYFRFPYLRTGANEARRRDAEARLASRGYRVAPVTAATSEWLLADYYEDAIVYGDDDLAAEIAGRYVYHMVQTLEWAEQMARDKGIERMTHITIAHANGLAADHLGDVLTALEMRGWDFVTLDEAMEDPAYSLRDAYSGKCGCSWLARIEPPLRRTTPYVFGDAEDAIRAEFGPRIDALRTGKL